MATSEKTLIATRPSRIIALGYYVAAFFLFLLAGSLWFFSALLPALGFITRASLVLFGGVFLAFLGFLLVLIAEIKRLATKYVITDFRVMRMEGLLRRSQNAMPYTKMERVHLTQGILQRILGIGTVVVDTGEDQIQIASVRDPGNVERTIMGRMQGTR